MLDRKYIIIQYQNSPIEFSYYDFGSGQNCLIFLHGIQGSKDTFEYLKNSELSKNFRIIIPDLPGFGDSTIEDNEDYDLKSQSLKLIGLLNTLKIDNFIAYGHSLGGMIATLLLSIAPERVLSIISSEGNLKLQDCGESRKVFDMTLEEFKEKRYPEIFAKGIKASVKTFYYTSKSVVEYSKSEKLLEILENTTCPALFIRGELSHFITIPKGTNLEVISIPDETHFTLAKSDKIASLISRFLNKNKLIA